MSSNFPQITQPVKEDFWDLNSGSSESEVQLLTIQILTVCGPAPRVFAVLWRMQALKPKTYTIIYRACYDQNQGPTAIVIQPTYTEGQHVPAAA